MKAFLSNSNPESLNRLFVTSKRYEEKVFFNSASQKIYISKISTKLNDLDQRKAGGSFSNAVYRSQDQGLFESKIQKNTLLSEISAEHNVSLEHLNYHNEYVQKEIPWPTQAVIDLYEDLSEQESDANWQESAYRKLQYIRMDWIPILMDLQNKLKRDEASSTPEECEKSMKHMYAAQTMINFLSHSQSTMSAYSKENFLEHMEHIRNVIIYAKNKAAQSVRSEPQASVQVAQYTNQMLNNLSPVRASSQPKSSKNQSTSQEYTQNELQVSMELEGNKDTDLSQNADAKFKQSGQTQKRKYPNLSDRNPQQKKKQQMCHDSSLSHQHPSLESGQPLSLSGNAETTMLNKESQLNVVHEASLLLIDSTAIKEDEQISGASVLY